MLSVFHSAYTMYSLSCVHTRARARTVDIFILYWRTVYTAGPYLISPEAPLQHIFPRSNTYARTAHMRVYYIMLWIAYTPCAWVWTTMEQVFSPGLGRTGRAGVGGGNGRRRRRTCTKRVFSGGMEYYTYFRVSIYTYYILGRATDT